MKRIIQFLFLVLLIVYAVNSKAIPTFFDQNSYQEILNKKKNENFLMLLWSLDCAPCIEDFSVISKFHKNNPEVDIVLISTDDIVRLNEISAIIAEHKLKDIEQWIFQSNQFQKLSHSIDPKWYGELPRSYFYSSGKLTGAYSGRLHLEDLDKWLLGHNEKNNEMEAQ